MLRFPTASAFKCFFSIQRWTSPSTRIRHKHNGNTHQNSVLASTHDSSASTWFSNSSPSSKETDQHPLWSVEEPLKEITSFDDFGYLSLGRSTSNDTLSTIGEKSFLDHLLKSDSSSMVTNIPTSVDCVELGGSSGSVEQLEVLLSEGFDVSAVLREMSDPEPEIAVMDVGEFQGGQPEPFLDDVEGSTESPFLMSNMKSTSISGVQFLPTTEKTFTRKLMSEEEMASRRSTLKEQSSQEKMAHSSDSTLSTEPFSESEPHISVEQETATPIVNISVEGPSTSESVEKQLPQRFEPVTDRTHHASIAEVLCTVDTENMSSLRGLLMVKKWPELYTMGPHVNRILSFIVENATDVEETMMFIRDFASSNPRAFVRDEIVVSLAVRAARSEGQTAAVSVLKQFRNMFLTRAPNSKSSRLRSTLAELYDVVCLNETGVLDSQTIVDTAVDLDYDSDARLFLRSFATQTTSRVPFDVSFRSWSTLSLKYGQTAGVDSIWDSALCAKEQSAEKRAKNTGLILAHCGQFDHPFKTMADLICSLIRLNSMEEAKLVFSKVSVSGRYFREPLSRFASDKNGLAYVERLAELVTFSMFGERRKGGRKKAAVPDTETEPTSPNLPSELSKTIDDFIGIGGRRKQAQPTTHKKNEKRKMHRVDEEQLHELADSIQALWLKLADASDDVASIDRMLEWSQKNRVEITIKQLERVKTIRSRVNSQNDAAGR